MLVFLGTEAESLYSRIGICRSNPFAFAGRPWKSPCVLPAFCHASILLSASTKKGAINMMRFFLLPLAQAEVSWANYGS